MNTYRVYMGGRCTYDVQASSISIAIRRGIQCYLTGLDISDVTEERKTSAIKHRRKDFNRLNDLNRSDEGSFNLNIRVKRIG